MDKATKNISCLFNQSETENPYHFYAQMLSDHPVYWDDFNKIWALYTYKDCSLLLNTPKAFIPPIGLTATDDSIKLNEYATTIMEHLIRLNNPPIHSQLREITLKLFSEMKMPSLIPFLEQSIHGPTLDWVETICKKLAPFSILTGFHFNKNDVDFILSKIDQLIKIMLPNKSAEQVLIINEVTKEIYNKVEQHIINTENLYSIIREAKSEKDLTLKIVTSNLIGLLIQSYDACRGLTSNTLLCYLKHQSFIKTDKKDFDNFILEVLRYDSPIHNTRRIVSEDIQLGSQMLKKGEVALIVLASANRDPAKFNHPQQFNINRTNNLELLTFGRGIHACLAKQFSIHLASTALAYLTEKFTRITLLEPICFEPLINARLAQQLIISVS